MSRTQARRLILEDPLPRAADAAAQRSTWIVVVDGPAGRAVLGHVPNATHHEALTTAAAFFLLPSDSSLALADWHACTSEDRFAAKGVCVLPAALSLGA